jgi:hypothetical protein
MFRRTQQRNAVWPLLCGLIVVGVWGNSLAWTVCPYMAANGSHCFGQRSSSPSHGTVEDAHMQHMHSHVMQMSDMDVKHMEGASSPQSLLTSFLTAESRVNSFIVGLTGSSSSCSHCIIHAKAGANSSSRSVLVNSPSDESSGPDSLTANLKAVLLLIPRVETHDHSPPGSDNSHYILNSTFRI